MALIDWLNAVPTVPLKVLALTTGTGATMRLREFADVERRAPCPAASEPLTVTVPGVPVRVPVVSIKT